MTDRGGRAGRIAIAAVIVAMFVLPLLTARLPYRTSLVFQAVVSLAATLALVGAAALRAAWRTRPVPPRAVLLGWGLYAAATAQGTVVALLRGNDLSLAAGQLLALGLLPLAAAATYGLAPILDWRTLAAGLVAGVCASTVLQYVLIRWGDLGWPSGARLMLPNALTAAGSAPLALFLGLALAGSGRRLSRGLAWAGIVVMAYLIAASKTRSLWLVIPIGAAVFLGMVLGRARLLTRRIVIGAATTALAAAAAGVATVAWWNRDRPNLAAGRLASGSAAAGTTATLALPAHPSGAIRVRGTLTCNGTGDVWIRADGSGVGPGPAGVERLGLNVAGQAPARFLFVLRPRTAGGDLTLSLDDPDRLECSSSTLVVDEIGPVFAAKLVGRAVALVSRPPDPGAGAAPGAFAGDASIAFRVREMSAVAAAIRNGPWWTWILGHGLGATFPFQYAGYDNQGNVVRFERPNYIHNLYLFLPFKLGIVGALAVLAALALFVLSAARAARDRPLGSSDRRFLAAAVAVWITYLAWSAAAPEIVDFRLAPFWGALVGLTAATVAREP